MSDPLNELPPPLPRPSQTPGAAPAPGAGARGTPGWEQQVLEKLVIGTLEEKRRARRWGIFFKLAGLLYVGVLIVVGFGWFSGADVARGRHTALIDVKGVIASGGEASAEAVIAALRSAFGDAKTAGVVMRINSPGGSPVQAGLIHDEIRRLRAKHPDTPLYAVVEEICASGGYYVAAAADRIYVDKASLIGSIGVLIDGFGFTGTMERLGVERRLITAGENKGFLDPFSPLNETDRKHAQTMIGEIHQQFIDIVKKGRGERLKNAEGLFGGLVWTGARSIELGLADALGSLDSVARDVIKAEEVVDFSSRDSLANRLAKRVGVSAGEALARSLRAAGEAPTLR